MVLPEYQVDVSWSQDDEWDVCTAKAIDVHGTQIDAFSIGLRKEVDGDFVQRHGTSPRKLVEQAAEQILRGIISPRAQ